METTDNLFALIKSLNKSEKGYFKKHANFHVRNNEKNNYTKIFDAIDLQKVYSEPKLLKKFKGERFINQFAVAKNYLYDMVLESLEAYNKTITIELRSLMNRVEILVDKGLHTQAKKILKKAKKIALEREKFSYISEINLMEQSIYRLQHDTKSLKNNVEMLAYEIKKTAKQIENVALYEKIKNQMYLQYIETGGLRSETEIKNFDWLLENPLLKNEEQALSVSAKILYNELRSTYYEYIGDSKKSYTYSLNLMQLIEKNPLILEASVNFPTLFLYRHSIRCSNAGIQHEALEAVSRMEFLKPRTEIQKSNLPLKALHTKLTVYLQMGKIKQCLDLIPKIKVLLDNSKQVDNLLKEAIYWQIISLLIISEQYKSALNWFIKANLEDVSLRQDLDCIGRIIEIILHYELGNFDIIEYRLKSAHRFLSIKGKLYPLENVFLSSFRHLINDTDKQGRMLFRDEIKLFLESETAASLESNFLVYFVVVSWLKSKVENEKLQEIILRKLKPVSASNAAIEY
jgi:hypothetical protein